MAIYCTHTDTEKPRVRPARHADLLALSSDSRKRAVADCNPSESGVEVTEPDPGLNGIRHESTLTLLAEADGRVVGLVNLTLQADQLGQIHGLWIDPLQQDSTLPLRLMAAILKESKRLGCLKVDMDANAKAFALIAMLIDSGVRAGDGESPAADKSGACLLDI